MKITIEPNHITFLDTKLTKIHGAYKFNVFQRYRSKRILSNFDKEIPLIKEKFIKAKGCS